MSLIPFTSKSRSFIFGMCFMSGLTQCRWSTSDVSAGLWLLFAMVSLALFVRETDE
jgi:hypothetical protein